MNETLLLPARHKLDADAYFRMAELGILERHDCVELKIPLYARAGITEFWLVDVAAKRLEAHRQPGPDGDAAMTIHGPGEHLALAAAPDIVVRLPHVRLVVQT